MIIKRWNPPGLPCVNISIEGCARVVAVVNMIDSILCTFVVTKDVLTQEGFPPEKASNVTIEGTAELERSDGIPAVVAFHYLTWILLYLKDVVDFVVSFFLFKAVGQRNLVYCKVYFLATFFVLQAYILFLIDICFLRLTYTITFSVVIGVCYHLIYKPYSVWVILNFMKIVIEEVKLKEKRQRNSPRRLTETELEDFYKGFAMLSSIAVTATLQIENENKSKEDIASKANVENLENWLNNTMEGKYIRNDVFGTLKMPLRHEAVFCSFKKEFELDQSQFTIDETKVLGCGQFGTVFWGQLQRHDEKPCAVAVRTIRSSEVSYNDEYFKDVLDEIKVMCYIGSHPNIVNLEGVCTTEIANQNLWIVMELCEKGSLESYLRANKGCFKEIESSYRCRYMRKSEEYMKRIMGAEETITTKNLVRWSHEVGLGMEFLAQKKVCHGDLALRNILLTVNRTAKITDFASARTLHNYALYAKDEETALPWRYMAPETMRNLTFSQQTDVWTYGVTLWEIFSLGQTPWSKYEYGVEYVSAILGGSRLARPTHCPSQMYEIMEECWSLDEKLRPTFSQLVIHTKVLREIFDKFENS